MQLINHSIAVLYIGKLFYKIHDLAKNGPISFCLKRHEKKQTDKKSNAIV